MAFIPWKGEGAALVSKGSARVSRKCLLHPCGEASCLLWSWPLAWAEGGESCSSFVGHRKGRPSPSANRHEQSAHFPAQLCQCWRYSAVDSTLLRFAWFLTTSCLCPEKCENLISWWFPSWLPARGVNHSTTVLQPGLPSADYSLPTQSQWSRMAPSRHLLTSFRLCWCSPCPAADLVRKPAEDNPKLLGPPN